MLHSLIHVLLHSYTPMADKVMKWVSINYQNYMVFFLNRTIYSRSTNFMYKWTNYSNHHSNVKIGGVFGKTSSSIWICPGMVLIYKKIQAHWEESRLYLLYQMEIVKGIWEQWSILELFNFLIHTNYFN